MSTEKNGPSITCTSVTLNGVVEVCRFDSHGEWVAKAQRWLRGYVNKTLFVDAKGRWCRDGKDMKRARDEGAFPVVVYTTEEIERAVHAMMPKTMEQALAERFSGSAG